MSRMRSIVMVMGAAALVVAACAGSDDSVTSGSDGDPAVSAVCAPDHPDCEDTVVVSDSGTGGGLPTAPEPSGDVSPSSGFVVGSGLTIDEALAYDGSEPVAVGGFVVTTSDGTSLCDALAESFPPQCGGSRLDVLNPELLTDLVLEEEGDTQWSPEPIVLLGEISGSQFTILSNVSG